MERPFPSWIEEEFAVLREQEQLILDDPEAIHEHVVRLRMLAAALTTHIVRKYPPEPGH